MAGGGDVKSERGAALEHMYHYLFERHRWILIYIHLNFKYIMVLANILFLSDRTALLESCRWLKYIHLVGVCNGRREGRTGAGRQQNIIS